MPLFLPPFTRSQLRCAGWWGPKKGVLRRKRSQARVIRKGIREKEEEGSEKEEREEEEPSRS